MLHKFICPHLLSRLNSFVGVNQAWVALKVLMEASTEHLLGTHAWFTLTKLLSKFSVDASINCTTTPTVMSHYWRITNSHEHLSYQIQTAVAVPQALLQGRTICCLTPHVSLLAAWNKARIRVQALKRHCKGSCMYRSSAWVYSAMCIVE